MRRQIVNAGLGLLHRCSPAQQAAEGASAWAGSWCLKRSYADDANLKKTVLFDFHVAHGGKMVPFAGWSMPIQYKDSIMESTTHCREQASLFDVSHMCGFTLRGKDAIPFLETLVVGDLVGLKHNTGTLSVYTNDKGGIIDDTVITKVTDTELYNVVNAGCRDKDLAHIGKHLEAYKAQGKQVDMELHDDRSLLALQGPAAAEVLQALTDEDLKSLTFSGFRRMQAAGMPVWVTRTGYTGEDGFEISVPNSHAVGFAEKLVANSKVRLAGLGPRDSLRLEAGLCLYGNDLDENISPIEAGLAWCVGKRRREKFDFLGGEVVKQHLAGGVTRKRVGILSQKGAPARQHTEIQSEDGKVVGEVTSGAYSPCLKKNIAMGYVTKGFDKVGTKLKLVVRGKANDAEVVKMPFVPTKYYKGA